MTNKLDEFVDRLDSVSDGFTDGVDEVFEAASGEIDLRDDGAPDRNEYTEYTQYLKDCHEWAVGELVSALERADSAVAGIDIEDYPSLGLNRPGDEDDKRRVQNGIAEVVESSSEAAYYLAILGRIEDSYTDTLAD